MSELNEGLDLRAITNAHQLYKDTKDIRYLVIAIGLSQATGRRQLADSASANLHDSEPDMVEIPVWMIEECIHYIANIASMAPKKRTQTRHSLNEISKTSSDHSKFMETDERREQLKTEKLIESANDIRTLQGYQHGSTIDEILSKSVSYRQSAFSAGAKHDADVTKMRNNKKNNKDFVDQSLADLEITFESLIAEERMILGTLKRRGYIKN